MMAVIKKKFIDIGANLTDGMYQGIYNGSKKHESDIGHVLKRAFEAGIEKLIITATSLPDSISALSLCNGHEQLYCTIGCHPTRCREFEEFESGPDEYLAGLIKLAQDNRDKVVAIGECGLDYDRTNFCPMDIQKKYFMKQLEAAEITGLPLFLHCRNAGADLVSILSPWRERLKGGVVHSFDGTREEMESIVELDFYVGLNGCSLKTENNLKVAMCIPKNRLLIETDCPWCEIRPSHSGFQYVKTVHPNKKKEKWDPNCLVKSRNEPCNIVQVLDVIAAIRNDNPDDLAEIIYENTKQLFFSSHEITPK